MGVLNAVGPFPHGLGDRILERRRPGSHCMHFRSQQTHPVDVQRLALGIYLTHVYLALHVH